MIDTFKLILKGCEEDGKLIKGDCYRQYMPHIYSKMNYFFDVDEKFLDSSVVYFIDGFYIGKTTNLGKRLYEHLIDVLLFSPEEVKNHKYNLDKVHCLLKKLQKGRVKVEILSFDIDEEKSLIIEYSKKYNLTNKQFNPNYTKEKNTKINKKKTLKKVHKIYKLLKS